MGAQLDDEGNLADAANLAANRRGVITDAQRDRAIRLELDASEIALGLISLLCAAGAAGGYAAWVLNAEGWAGWATALLMVTAVLLAGAVSTRLVGRWRLAGHDLEAGDDLSATGRVVWRGGQPIAEFPGRSWWAVSRVRGLALGVYRFYYLPRSGYLLSADFQSDQLAAVPSETSGLGSVYHVTPSDLAANTAGQIGPHQAAKLWRGVLRHTLLAVAATAPMAYIAWLYPGTDIINQLVMIGLLIFVFACSGSGAILRLFDLRNGRVDSLQGPVSRTAVEEQSYSRGFSTRYMRYEAHLLGQTFPIDEAIYHLIRPGRVYRASIAPLSRTLLALERTHPRVALKNRLRPNARKQVRQ